MLRGVLNRLLGVLVPTAWLYILTWQVSPNFWRFLPLPDNLRTLHLRHLSWVLQGRKEGRGDSPESCSIPYHPQMDHFQILLNCTLSGSETTSFVLCNGKGNWIINKALSVLWQAISELGGRTVRYLKVSTVSRYQIFSFFVGVGGNKCYSAFNSSGSKSSHCSLGSDHL